jgi:hypothetical protein
MNWHIISTFMVEVDALDSGDDDDDDDEEDNFNL